MSQRFRLMGMILLFAIITLTGCGGGKSPATPVLTTITITPSSVSLLLNDTHQFTAVGKDQNGNIMVITPTWNVSGSIGTISPDTGITTTFTPEALGSGAITATVGSVSGSATISVVEEPPVLTSITIEPASVSMPNGTTQEFSVVGRDQFNSIIALSSDPEWSTTVGSGSVAPISGNPTTFTATTVCYSTISATVGSLTATAQVTITAAPVLTRIAVSPDAAQLDPAQTQVFTANGYDQYDSPYMITPTWSVSGGIGILSTTSGSSTTLTATTAGSGQVTATVGLVSDSASVTVNSTELRVPQDYPTLQAAIDAAPDGGTVLLSPGTHTGGIIIENKSLTLRSTDPDDPAVVAGTVISGNNTNPAIIINGNGSNTVTVEGFTVTEGKASSDLSLCGGGIYITGASTNIRKNVISGNSARRGAGIYITNAFATIEFNQIANNTADHNGGGICGDSGSSPIINNNTISGNRANGTNYWNGGGGLWLETSVELNNNTITGNIASGAGGGIHAASYLKVNNCTISSNSGNWGGGIFSDSNQVVSKDTVYYNNSGYNGYAIYLGFTASYGDLGGNSFSGNTPGDFR